MRRRLLLVPLLILLVLGLAWPTLAGLLADWWWFQELGYQVVFLRERLAFVGFGIAAGGLAALALLATIHLATRGLVDGELHLSVGGQAVPVMLTRAIALVRWPIVAVFSAWFGLAFAADWRTLLLAWHRTDWGVADPIFQRDIADYVFLLPALQTIVLTLLGLCWVSLILSVIIYRMRGDFVGSPSGLRISSGASRHLGVLAGLAFLLLAVRLWTIDIPSLVIGQHDLLSGATYTDLHARLPALRVSAVVALLAAVLVVRGAWSGALTRGVFQGVALYLLTALVGRGAIPAAMQTFFVAPTELTRETPYIEHHIAATRTAWGLDLIETRELEDAGGLTMADLRNNAPTIENVRLWDRTPLLQTFGQLQEIRTYYDFLSVDDDRYWIDGRYRQVLLSPRELQIASLPPQARNFINEHMTFTHGMGLTLGPVNQRTAEGLPVLFIKDLPPTSSVSLQVTRPQIYYGEVDYNYAVVGTLEREFDHPSGDGDVYAAYAGSGGVSIGTAFRRLVYATHFGASNLFFSSNITGESRILYYRNIVRRAKRALPFLAFDRDPYLVVRDNGELAWILDAYTTAGAYPYAQRIQGGVNYLRNSVKVVIDAYDGTVSAYLSAPDDPVVRTWERIFPGILHPLDAMPTDLRAHLRYPDEIFQAQTALYATYHLDSATEFYSREDQWQIPQIERGDRAVPFMRHIIMRLPGEQDAEFVYMVPYTPRGRENLAAWLVARNDGDHYGKLRVYRLSRQSLVFGPTQIVNRISQDTEISQQISLWDRSGSKVLRGDLLVIPIERSLLYVQPLYLQAEGGRIPELKRVILAYQNQVVMAETLDAALQRAFGGTGVSPTAEGIAPTLPTTGPGNGALIREAEQRYQAALQAQREGNWARYGEEIRALGDLLSRLRAGVEQPME